MRKQVVNVIDGGADPSGRTDCTEAFREALANVNAMGVCVTVPAGIYRLSGIICGEPPPTSEQSVDTAPPDSTTASAEPNEP